MTTYDLEKLSEDFRKVAGDKEAIKKLADAARKEHPSSHEVVDLCNQVEAARDAAQVAKVCDHVKAQAQTQTQPTKTPPKVQTKPNKSPSKSAKDPLSPIELRILAEDFRKVADDKAAIKKLADATHKDHPDDTEAHNLCTRFTGALDGTAVRVICDEIKAQPKPPPLDPLTLAELKRLAESFRAVAADSVAVTKLADDTRKAHPNDTEAGDLCTEFKTAADADAICAIADRVKDRIK